MNDLDKVSKNVLEDCVMDIISDLKTKDLELAEKYQNMLDEHIYYISPEEAKVIVMNMKPKGEKFSMDYVKALLMEKDKPVDECNTVNYYLTMNMIYNDYQLLFEKYPVLNQKDAYYLMASCFINDIDGPKYKVGKYFLM